MANKLGDLMTNPDFLAQAGHTALGVLFVAVPLALTFSVTAALWGTLAAAVYGLSKEIVLDPLTEKDNPFFWVGAIDLAFIVGGSALFWGAWALIGK